MSVCLVSTGSALPKVVLSNDALIAAKGLDSTSDWIVERTGITQRYMAGEGETTATLATAAVAQALERAGITPKDVGVLVVATCTPDLSFPSVAALVHGALGMAPTCAALDVNAVCSGFIYALNVAQGLLSVGQARYAVVVGAETFSRVLDWADRGTCVLFGDGAGAVVLENRPHTHNTGILGVTLGADGSHAAMLTSTGGVSTTQTAGVVRMNGRDVYKHAVRQMSTVSGLFARNGLTLADVDWVIPHQANTRILTAAAAAMGIPADRVINTVGLHANTSSASIPLALDVAMQDGRIRPGHLLLLQAFGAGFTWGDALIRV